MITCDWIGGSAWRCTSDKSLATAMIHQRPLKPIWNKNRTAIIRSQYVLIATAYDRATGKRIGEICGGSNLYFLQEYVEIILERDYPGDPSTLGERRPVGITAEADADRLRAIWQMRQDGHSYPEIAKRYGMVTGNAHFLARLVERRIARAVEIYDRPVLEPTAYGVWHHFDHDGRISNVTPYKGRKMPC